MTPPPMMTTRARLGKDVATVAPGAGAGGAETASPETAGTGALCIEPLLWLADDRSVSGRQEKVQMKSKRRPQRRRTPDQDVRAGPPSRKQRVWTFCPGRLYATPQSAQRRNGEGAFDELNQRG